MVRFLQHRNYSTGASCQKSPFKTSTTDIPEMPPCDFKPDEFKVKISLSMHPSIRVAVFSSHVHFVQGMSKERMLEIRQQNCFPMTTKVTYYKKPVFIHQGHMQWLWDVDGKRYLDLFAGVATVSVGHSHP